MTVNPDHFIAHRGWQHHYPENTWIAISKAIEVGAKHIEVDVQLTADLIPVLSHDADMLRMSGEPIELCKTDFKTLSLLSASEPDRFAERFKDNHLCSLHEFLEKMVGHPEVTIYVELKRHSIDIFGVDTVLDKVMPLMKKLAPSGYIISFNTAILQMARQQGWKNIAPVLKNFHQGMSDEILQLLPPLVFINDKYLSPKNSPSALAFPCAVYEINSINRANHLFELGVKYVETFQVGEMINHFSDTELSYE